jgi:hypothetical protein
VLFFVFIFIWKKKEKKPHVADDGHLYTIVDSLTTEYNNTLFKFVMAYQLFKWRWNLCRCIFIVCLYLYFCWRSNYQEEMLGSINLLNPTTLLWLS